MSADKQICPTCGRGGYEPPRAGPGPFDENYRELRRREGAQAVAFFRARADHHQNAGRGFSASVWREEADKLEKECASVWGTESASAHE